MLSIGFYTKWDRGAYYNSHIIHGDEPYAESMCRTLRKYFHIDNVDLYAPNHLPNSPIDILIYLNDVPPNPNLAKKHILYLQNPYEHDSQRTLKKLYRYPFQGFMFISKKILENHIKNGYQGLYLPFGVDTDTFFPGPCVRQFAYDICFVGNGWKEQKRTELYLFPAMNYRFGLFGGNWGGEWFSPIFGINNKNINLFRNQIRKILHRKTMQPYREKLYRKWLGKIPADKIPVLYRSSKICLNYSALDNIKYNVVTIRTLEAMACKSFVITDLKSADPEFSKSVVFSEGGDDLTFKIKHYLKHDQERLEIANRGYNYVHKNCTLEKRMGQMLKYINSIL
jgi:spore maturation protein CgeB